MSAWHSNTAALQECVISSRVAVVPSTPASLTFWVDASHYFGPYYFFTWWLRLFKYTNAINRDSSLIIKPVSSKLILPRKRLFDLFFPQFKCIYSFSSFVHFLLFMSPRISVMSKYLSQKECNASYQASLKCDDNLQPGLWSDTCRTA